MKAQLDRREFLKLAGLLSLSYAAPRFMMAPSHPQPGESGKNILVIVFDALSAYNISLYGYARETMPNLAQLAERAVVYNNHFASGNFTTPGTASLLTGTHSWTHRAIQHNGTVADPFINKSIFHALPGYHRIAYSHNPLVNTLLAQFQAGIDDYVPQSRLFLATDSLIHTLFGRDEDIATVGWTRTIKRKEEGYAYSLLLTHLYEKYRESKIAGLKPLFPRGLPNISGDNYFTIEHATDWLAAQVSAFPEPFFGYFHFLPPHFPYKTHKDFFEKFARDGWEPVQKPVDPFSQEKSPDNLLKWRTWYDEFILYVDREFGRLFNHLEGTGLLENTWLVFTSDHGEMFERGISGHLATVLHQPVVRVPLLIFEPGRRQGENIYTPTSAVDVMPTLLHVTGQEIPEWVEGVVLPPYAPADPEPDRSLFALNAKHNEQLAALTRATTMLVKGKYKLHYFFGYEELGGNGERIELYDMEADPEELHDLYPSQKGIGPGLLEELKSKLAQVDEPYI